MRVPRVLFCVLIACLVFTCAGFRSDDASAPIDPSNFATINQITHDGLIKTAVLSDGTALYVAEQKGGHQVISKIVPGTGEATTVATPFADAKAVDVSPDRKSLLAVPIRAPEKKGQLWVVPLGKVESRQLGDVRAEDAAWSRNGEELVTVRGNEIWISAADGSNGKKLGQVKGRPFGPRFSPDGKLVRFSVADLDVNATTLWEVGTDGSNLHEMLTGWPMAHTVCCGVWSQDGKAYIFQTTQSWPRMVSMLWSLAGTSEGEPRQLTNGPMSFGSPWPAAESEKIWALGVNPLGEVVKYDVGSAKSTKVLSGISATDLDFSADGQWITYVSIPDATLWRCRPDGSDRRQLTFGPDQVALPRWSPDSKQIAYVSLKTGHPAKIMLIGVDGGTATPMYAEEPGQVDAFWTKDGQRMIYGYQYGTSKQMTINVLDLKSQKVTKLPGSEGLFSPRMSPDERYVAALTLDFTTVKLFDFKTQKWTTWFKEPAGSVSYPSWSKDSKSVYFDDMMTGEESIRQVKLGEDRPERVADVQGVDRYSTQFGYWMGMAPDGSFLFVQDRSTQEVYSLNLRSMK